MGRLDWNCPFCNRSLTYKKRNFGYLEIGMWLRCIKCGKLTQYDSYWDADKKEGIFSMTLPSRGKMISFSSNVSGARWFDFYPMPKSDNEETLMKIALERLIEKLEFKV
jgi:hypothetical protein